MLAPYATSGIVAQAFQKVELSPPSSFADDTEQAQQAATFYPKALAYCLGRTDWSFASSLVLLPAVALPVGIATDDCLPFTYALPGDCLKLRAVLPDGTEFRIDGQLLRADAPAPLKIRFTRLVENESHLPEEFRTAVALRLAWLLAPRWLGVEAKIQGIWDEMTAALSLAAKGDRNSASPQRWGESDGGDWARMAVR